MFAHLFKRSRDDSGPRPQLDLRRLEDPILCERCEAAPEPVIPDARGDLLHSDLRDEEKAEEGKGAARRARAAGNQ